MTKKTSILISFYDVWHNGRWVGMTGGGNPIEGREQLVEAEHDLTKGEWLLTPYIPELGSFAVYEAITGKKAIA